MRRNFFKFDGNSAKAQSISRRRKGEQFICALRNPREREIQGEQGRRVGAVSAKCSINESCSERERSCSAGEAVRLKLPSSQTPEPFSKGDIFDCARGAIRPSPVCIPLSASKRVVRFAAPSARVNAPLRESERADDARRACSLAAQTAHNYSSRFVLAR